MSGVTENRTPTKLKELCTITSSKRIYAADYVDEGVPFVRGKEVVQRFSHLGKLQSELFISRTKFEIIKDRFGAPKGGDLLLTSVGTLGVPYLVADDDEFYFKDGNLIWFRELKELNGKFFYYWLQSHAGKAQLQKCTIGTSQPAYTIERLKEIDVPDFSLIKQASIASVLSAYDDLIENNRRRIQLLEQAARLLYKEWFVHRRFPGHEHTRIIDGVPEGWEKKVLGAIAPLRYGKALKKDDRVPGAFPVYGSSGVVGTHAKALVPGPTIIVGRKGNVGSVYWSPDDCHPIDTVYYIDSELCSLFLYYTLQQMTFISTDVAVPGLNRDFAHSRSLLVADQKILRLFEDTASPLHQQMELLKRQNALLAKARDLLLPKLMNGEVAV